MTEHKWMGVEAVDGAWVGPLRLYRYGIHRPDACDWKVHLLKPDDSIVIVQWCPLSEVDSKTREWIRSLAELLPEWGVMKELCEAALDVQRNPCAISMGNLDIKAAKYRELVK